jgi:hypothetical protein
MGMLELGSNRWQSLSAAGGNPRLVPELIASLKENATPEEWAEVMEQIGHQRTHYSAAYASVPHVLELAKTQGRTQDPEFIYCLGAIAEPFESGDPPPDDLRSDYDTAMAEAAALSFDALLKNGQDVKHFVYLLQGAAGLHHRRGPGTRLECLIQNNLEAYCPSCDSYLTPQVGEERIDLVPEDERGRPLSERTPIRPRPAPDLKWERQNPPVDDFSWLCALCPEAGQTQVLTWICYLYGDAVCPVCQATFELMPEVEREQEG